MLPDSRLLGLLAAVIVGAGCSSAPPPPIPVTGTPNAVAGLAGSWTGDYRLSDGTRRGVITFSLDPGDSVAAGSVIMSPSGASPGTTDAAGRVVPGAHPQTEPLAVRFIEVQNGILRGRLDPYIDPDCVCPVETVFEGRLNGDRIEGTFVIRNTVEGTTRAGLWSVARRSGGMQ